MIQKIKCFFGLHKWIYYKEENDVFRLCLGCDKLEKASYDPMYGCDWEEE